VAAAELIKPLAGIIKRLGVHRAGEFAKDDAHPITGNSRERFMTRIDIGRLAFVLCLSAAVLTACGRKGDLDLPGGGQPVVKTIKGKKVEQVEDRPFVLDPLL
jgi:predicted small lipoprotein YifL